MKIVRFIVITLLLLAYALSVHHVNTTGKASTLGGILVLIPLFIIAISIALQATSRLKGGLLVAAVSLGAFFLWAQIMQNTSYLFWLQDIGLLTILLATFARTLKAGQKPLCVKFAEIINQGNLPPEHERYARNITIAWAAFFAMMIVISSILFFFAPLATWSFFVNFLTLPLVGLMFVTEYLVRRQLLTDLPEGSVLDAIRTYINHTSVKSR